MLSLLLLADATVLDDEALAEAASLPLTNTVEAVLPLEGATALRIAERDASVTVVGSDREDVLVTVDLESQRIIVFSNRRTTWAIHRAEIVGTLTDDELLLEIALPVRVDRDWLASEWRVEVPRALAARIEVTNGSIDVSGLRGGVELESINGSIDLDVLAGPITAETINGGIDAVLRNPSYGEVRMDTRNGGTDLSVDGEELAVPDDGPALQGPGGPDVTLSTINAGISLEILTDG